MTVYAVNDEPCGAWQTLAVFTTRGRAEAFIAARRTAQPWAGDMKVEEFTLDEPDPLWLEPIPIPTPAETRASGPGVRHMGGNTYLAQGGPKPLDPPRKIEAER